MAISDAVAVHYVQVVTAYLDRNDFTDIRQIAGHLLEAKDGARKVYVWIDPERLRSDGRVIVPAELFKIAQLDRARVDVVCLNIVGEQMEFSHVMNVVV